MSEAMTRRAFLVRAAELGIAVSAAGPLLAACAGSIPTATPSHSPSITPLPSFGGTLPVIDPTPTSATYGEMLETSSLAAAGVPPGLIGVLNAIAAEASVPVSPVPVEGRRQARLTITADDSSVPSQAYTLEIAPAANGPAITIRAGDEAGALNGLLSVGELLVAQGSTWWLRAASVDDHPGFVRRGAILDPWVVKANGPTDESRAKLLDRVRLGARYKLDFVDLVGRDIWPELLAFCTERHIELLSAMGFQSRLTTTPRDELKWRLGQLFDQGGRSFSFAWDDMRVTDAASLARAHADVFIDMYDFLKARDSTVRVSAILPPYGGIPGRNLIAGENGAGERYLDLMGKALPSDVRVFWTGDGGVFSPRITAAGAKAYAAAVGHEVGIWDNDAIRFAQGRYPLSGRDPELGAAAPTYMGNLAGEWGWGESNGRFALLTSLFYTWNPVAYDPYKARDTADAVLG